MFLYVEDYNHTRLFIQHLFSEFIFDINKLHMFLR